MAFRRHPQHPGSPAEHAQQQWQQGAQYLGLTTGDRATNLQRSIECFTEALRFYTAQTAPAQYAAIQNNLGVAYSNLPSQDRTASLARAIECFTEALRFYTAEAAPDMYAAIQNDLGAIYAELPAGDRGTNLQRSIECFTQALRFNTAQAAPAEHATLLLNLGTAYRLLPTGDQTANLAQATANLAQAIGYYSQALRFYPAHAAPAQHAAIQKELAKAYSDLSTGDRSANLARAIDCYTEALRFYTVETAPADYARIQHNLGTAYRQLPTGDWAANLARAIDCYRQALRFYTAEAAPTEYATALASLGSAYLRLPTGDRAADLAEAIDCFTQALRFSTVEAAPAQYAMVQYFLGTAYRQLPTGDRSANLARAIECYRQALRFYTADAAPDDCRRTAHSLGSVYFEQGRWAEAHAAYSSAIRAGEFLYHATGSETGRQAELGAARDTVAADAYCLARLGRLDEAIQRLEAGRARALGEALARDRTVLREASQPDRAAFIAAADRIEAHEAEGRRGHGAEAGGRSFAERSAELVQAREDLAQVIERIRAYLPGFGGEGLGYAQIAAAAPAPRPLVYLLTTSRGGLALLVPAGSRAPAPEHAIWLDNVTDEWLDAQLVQRQPSGTLGGYLVGQMTGDLAQLAAAVTENIEILRRDLLGSLAQRLADQGAAGATVIPVGRLSLLPLPAAAPDGCTIALAPSARAMQVASRALRDRAGEASALLAVSNPLPPPQGRTHWTTRAWKCGLSSASSPRDHGGSCRKKPLPEQRSHKTCPRPRTCTWPATAGSIRTSRWTRRCTSPAETGLRCATCWTERLTSPASGSRCCRRARPG